MPTAASDSVAQGSASTRSSAACVHGDSMQQEIASLSPSAMQKGHSLQIHPPTVAQQCYSERRERFNSLLSSLGCNSSSPDASKPMIAQVLEPQGSDQKAAAHPLGNKPSLWSAARSASSASSAVGALDKLTNEPALARSEVDMTEMRIRKHYMQRKKTADEGPSDYDLDVLHNQTVALLGWVDTIKEGMWATDSREQARQEKQAEREALEGSTTPAEDEQRAVFQCSITPPLPSCGLEVELMLSMAVDSMHNATKHGQVDACAFFARHFQQLLRDRSTSHEVPEHSSALTCDQEHIRT
eukprot:CAMPEP_0115834188 /NCGR_PEP_ID=MMETSP0287-20121206/3556_1 /TAXON_ID=412157 /ORGANISM="Chrysochromulina rotalis, Strain UIO044" /LENGTH=298 /DNA_ID=CAMNT_0003287619 /DNA_START=222 /DNA_END=1117 /DNA_ORIENTATION=-